MKRLSAMVIFALFCSLLLASCGKTSEQKQMESDLNKRVMQLHDSGMAKMRQAQGLDAQLDSAKALHDSLAAKFPKDAAGHSGDDIAQAKGKIESAQAAMHAWMSTHKPYDPEAKHDEVMAKLNADVQELTNVSHAVRYGDYRRHRDGREPPEICSRTAGQAGEEGQKIVVGSWLLVGRRRLI